MFYISEDVPGYLCVERGYPNPDTDPVGWIDAIRRNAALQIEEHGRDLDWARDIVRLAIVRADREPPRPLSAIELEVLEELAA